MPKKNIQRILLLLIVVGGSLAGFLLQSWPGLIFAQENEDGVAANSIYLPYIVDGSVATGVIENAPTVGDIEDNHTHSHPQPPLHSWPPQPEGVAEVVWIASAPSDAVIAAQETATTAEQIAFASDAVQAALGERFVQSATTYVHAKNASGTDVNAADAAKNATVRVAYFSYSHNVTVEAIVQAGVVSEVKTLDASIYQPEPTRGEKQQAIALARTYFAAQGLDRVQQLEGYVIQAYQAEDSTGFGTGFYATRVLYVTFHAQIDERPEFVAWVDLTNATVIKSFQDSYQVAPDEEAQ